MPGFDVSAWWAYLNSPEQVQWHQDHAEIPIIAISLYLVFIFGVGGLMEKRKEFNLKFLFTVWNLLLAVFSCFGAYHLVPLLVETTYTKGWRYSICEPSPNWYQKPPNGVWVVLFIYSKFPELIDTVFLVLRKKPVIFLHWFHHVTVLLYCWHAYHHQVAAGLWFAAMNYSVHSIMYLYYFLMNAGFYSLMRPIAPFITGIQILQMIGGITVLVNVGWILETEENPECSMDRANYKLGLCMYISYFILFAILFWDKYIATPSKKGERKQVAHGCVDDAAKLDASGMFRGSEREEEEEKHKKL